jgi:hypothetical protein
MKKWIGLMLFAVLSTGFVWADSVASGNVTWAGKSIEYKVTGEDNANVSADSDNKKCFIRLEVDGKKHDMLITRMALEYQGVKIPLGGWKKMELIGNAEKIRIVLDDKEVGPKK